MYAILRTDKHSSGGSLAGASQHATRERETPNADPTRAHLNHVVFGAADPAAEIERRIAELRAGGMKMRSDAVRAIELFIGASPEFFRDYPDRKEDFYRQSTDWLHQTFGRTNVVSVIAHEDESTPHLSVFVLPLDRTKKERVEGKRTRGGDVRLNAKKWTGGRAKLGRMQTSFAKAVANLGLKRGQEHSLAHHTDVKEYYGLINKAKAMTGLSDALLALEEIERLMKSKKELSEQLQKLKNELAEKQIEVQQIKASYVEATKEGNALDALKDKMVGQHMQMIKNFDFALKDQVLKEGESVYCMLGESIKDYKGKDYGVLYNTQSVRYVPLDKDGGTNWDKFQGKYYVVTNTNGKLNYKEANMTQVMQNPSKLERQKKQDNGPKMGGM